MGFALGSLTKRKTKISDTKKSALTEKGLIDKHGDTGKNISSIKNESTSVGPYIISFYKKEIRRYFQDDTWYFSIDDIAKIADINPDLPFIRPGNPEKLAEAVKKFSKKIDGVEVAKPDDIAGVIPLFKGNMPGPIVDWLRESVHQPAPKVEDLSRPTTPSTQNQTETFGVKN